jgi:peptidoglycan/LPS O-acetylase OafA/YrhL
MDNQTRNLSFDFFRGVAILMIIVLHAAMTTPGIGLINSVLFDFVSRLSTGMQLFFVLSGYFIYQSMQKLSNNNVGVRIFLYKRMAKILPLYLLFLFLNIALFFVFSELYNDFSGFHRNTVTSSDINLNNIFLHIFMLQGFVPEYMHSLVDGSWSIVTEVYFYLLFPVIIFPFIKSLKKSIVVFMIILVISMYFGLYIAPIIWPDQSGFYYYFFLNQLPVFILGGVMSHFINQNQEGVNEYSSILFAFSVVLFFGLISGSNYPLTYHYLYGIVFVLMIIGSYPYMESFKGFFLFSAVVRLGKQAYAVFLSHLLIMYPSSYLLKLYAPNLNIAEFFLIQLLSILVFSYILSNYLFNRIDVFFVNAMNHYIRRNYAT